MQTPQAQQQHITYNYGQRQVIDAGVEHILKGITDYPFEFSGGPGTGKSVVLNAIKEESGLNPNRIAPMTFIGQAAVVMRLKGFHNAKTEHSWLFRSEIGALNDKESNIVYNQNLGVPELGVNFTPVKLRDIDCIFIDEGGSTPMKMRKYIEDQYKPTIVAGDINQLPPVGDAPAYLYNPRNVMFLTEIMRQKVNSGIPFIANRALQGLPIHYGYYGDAIVINESQLTNEMLLNADLLLCGTNKKRDYLNNLMRKEILGIRSDLPKVGEKIICRKNNWNREVDGISLANGLRGTVVSPVELSGFDGKTFHLDFMPDLFNGVFEDVDVDYEFFTAPCTKKNELKNRKYATGEKFDLAYAISVHLAQGGQAENVVYFEDYNNPSLENRINFTGATRAARTLIYVKKPMRTFFPSRGGSFFDR